MAYADCLGDPDRRFSADAADAELSPVDTMLRAGMDTDADPGADRERAGHTPRADLDRPSPPALQFEARSLMAAPVASNPSRLEQPPGLDSDEVV